jgi:hypothetical protein
MNADELELEEHDLLTPEGLIKIRGRLLGFSTSQREQHNHPSPVDVDTRWKCSACRWVEIRLLKDDDDSYVVSTLGRTIVQGETDRSRVVFTDSPFEVIERLTDRRPNQRQPRLPLAAALALSQAAAIDDGIRDAYVNRAVI